MGYWAVIFGRLPKTPYNVTSPLANLLIVVLFLTLIFPGLIFFAEQLTIIREHSEVLRYGVTGAMSNATRIHGTKIIKATHTGKRFNQHKEINWSYLSLGSNS